MSDTTSLRLSDKSKRTGELLIKRHPHTLSHPKIYDEGIKAVIQKLNEKGENFPDEPFDDLISDNKEKIAELEIENEFLESLKEKQKYRKTPPASNNSQPITKSGYHQEMRDGIIVNVEDYDD